MKYLNLSITLLLLSCQLNTKEVNESSSIEREASSAMESINQPTLIEGAIGLIIESNDYQLGEVIAIFSNDKRKQISEIAIREETQVLVLKCLAKEEVYYKVLLEDGRSGFIPCNEESVVFQTWQEHIINNVFAVSFDATENPLLKEASEESYKLYYDRDEFYHPSKIEGEWLQLRWGYEGSWEYGWIKWRRNDKLLVELFYFA